MKPSELAIREFHEARAADFPPDRPERTGGAEALRDGSLGAMPCSGSGKSSAPPSVGGAQPSSSRESWANSRSR